MSENNNNDDDDNNELRTIKASTVRVEQRTRDDVGIRLMKNIITPRVHVSGDDL